jgi:hypothetical protein
METGWKAHEMWQKGTRRGGEERGRTTKVWRKDTRASTQGEAKSPTPKIPNTREKHGI